MGEANFYYFTCLKLHLVFSGLQLFEREMANSLAIALVLATIAQLGSSRTMTGEWASKVCAAYYKASELGAFPPVYPGGFGWNDKVCLTDPSFYLECKFVNGVFVGEKRQCPPGKLFYHGANQMWEKTCVPADKCNINKQCPDWLGMMPPSPVLTECQRQRESALKLGNYAPSCDINGNFKPLQCGAGFCWCVYADGTKIPNTKCGKALSALTDTKCLLHRKDSTPVVFKPLQCRAGFCWCAYADGTKILNTKVIAAFSTLTDAKCPLYRITPPSPTDSFKPLQCGAGFCWCTFADGTNPQHQGPHGLLHTDGCQMHDFEDESSDPYRGSHNSRWHDQASMRLQDGAKAVHFRLVFRLRLRPSSAAELPHLPRRWNFRVQIMPGWRSLELHREDLL